ncbi:retrovirus-related Pol polyprotein from transposon 297 [Nephila pilipes]|uniref:Retrovirus-related Pol polyprotein from transposon 297 n=1 Tax=Nephila pilipes TaxID=299642 RepID=A0A8X6QMA4_NEPPI|nr:retrovirus-related Pol polyprotein from transposon 297 [Nephila pilipes]
MQSLEKLRPFNSNGNSRHQAQYSTTWRQKSGFSGLTAKISVPVEATANVAEPLTTLVKFVHQKFRRIIDSGTQVSVLREEITGGAQYEADGHIEIIWAFGEKEVTHLRILEMSTDDGVHGYMAN